MRTVPGSRDRPPSPPDHQRFLRRGLPAPAPENTRGMFESNARRWCSTSALNLGGQRCGALLDFRPLRHDTECTESAVGVQWQHSRAISFELEFKMKVRKNTTCGRKVACTCSPLVDAGTLVWQGHWHVRGCAKNPRPMACLAPCRDIPTEHQRDQLIPEQVTRLFPSNTSDRFSTMAYGNNR
jgi:hypothetical protein